jgi:hypothetical protein
MDRLSRRVPALTLVLGLLTLASITLAVVEDRTPARAQPTAMAQLDLPDGHERMLGIMRAGTPSHHLKRMRNDPEWQRLRDGSHAAHLEAYQAERDRMLGQPRAVQSPSEDRSR